MNWVSKYWFIPVLMLTIVLAAFLYPELTTVQSFSRYGEKQTLPGRAELQEKLYSPRKMLIVYGDFQPYEEYALKLRERAGEWMDIRLLPAAGATADSLKGTPVLLVGSPKNNPMIAHLSAGLPIKVDDSGLTFLDKRYDDSTDVLTLFYPNPADVSYPLMLTTGNSDERVFEYLSRRSFFGIAGDYQVFRNDRCIVFGMFDQAEGNRWGFDPKGHRDFEAERSGVHSTDHFRFVLHQVNLDADALSSIYSAREETYGRIEAFLNEKLNTQKIEYHLYPTCEDKGLITRNTRISHSDISENGVHAAIEGIFRGDDGVEESRVILRDRLGEPKTKALETGLSVHFSKDWRESGYRYWAARLYASGNLPALGDVVDNELFDQESELVMTPAAGTLVDYLVQLWSRKDFIKRYGEWAPGLQERSELENGWHGYLKNLVSEFSGQVKLDRDAFPKSDDFLKGFCHAHEGYAIYDGYLSKRSDEALARLASLGTNTVSITPFTYMSDANSTNFLPIVKSPGSENDESVIHAALAARSLGMSVMLKPHMWLTRSWPGAIEMKSDQDWEKFFAYYYRWIRHYALMAEMYRFEVLCVGVELAKATVGHEDEWRKMVGNLRKLYSGKLTYAANWGEEFEALGFWDAFDFIGLNCYYPLSDKEQPSDEELKSGFGDVVEKIESVHEKFNKPVVLTEIGFTSTPDPWREPHKDGRGRLLDLESQRRCYELVFQTLKKADWCSGIYWWKWPSYVEYGGLKSTGFTPCGKPAEQVVAKWYSRPW